MKYRHYAPSCAVYVAPTHEIEKAVFDIRRVIEEQRDFPIGLFMSRHLRKLLFLDNLEQTIVQPLSPTTERRYSLRPRSDRMPRQKTDIASSSNTSGKNIIFAYDYADERDPEAAVHELFAALRGLERRGVQLIICEALPEKGLGAAYMNRLRKAQGGGLTP